MHWEKLKLLLLSKCKLNTNKKIREIDTSNEAKINDQLRILQ